MQSRLREQLLKIEERKDSARRAEAVQAMVYESGDALEMAARAAEGAWDSRGGLCTRDKPVNQSLTSIWAESFEQGYLTAAAELAYILRCMRKGEPSNPNELRDISKRVYAEVYEDADDGIAKSADEQIEMGFD